MGLTWLGMGRDRAGFTAGMAGCPGFIVCPGVFKTTIMLMTIKDNRIRIFLLFIYFFVWLFVFSRRQQ